ncbi:hypothetical protein A3K63_03930 [Candidatus Micrarchaeota archaeon RBG_16_49_10]|nr:MAG: hypothetical protein A3K63_03930 [Candidatus Micrarchaeota archaeon RBG_16_49_10]
MSRDKFIAVSLAIIFVFAFLLRIIPFLKYDSRLITNWADDWWYLGMARYFAERHQIPALEPTYGNGIEFDYPPGMMLYFGALTQLTGVELVYLARWVAVGMGAFTVICVYILSNRLTGDYRIGLLSAILTASSIRYLSRSAAFASELFGHLLIPGVLFFLYRGLKRKDDMSLVVSGILFAGLILSHHLSTAVMMVTLVFLASLLFIFKRKEGLVDAKKIFLVIAIGLVISGLFWVKLAKGGIMNVVVKEAYSREGTNSIKAFYKNLGIPQFFLGSIGLLYCLYKRDTEHLFIAAWGLPCFIGLWDRPLAKALFGNNLLRTNPDLLYIFSPSLNTRYYDFLGPALSIAGSTLFFRSMDRLKVITRRRNLILLLQGLLLALVILSTPLPINSDILYEGSGYGWLKWAMTSFIDIEEFDSTFWMRDNLGYDVNILSDYESNEMILGMTARTVANGGTLKASLPVGTIYTEHLTIYFTGDLNESMRLIRKYNITHIFLSQRMIDKAWFAIESNSRFSYDYGSDMHSADLEKFETSECFTKVYDSGTVWLYQVNFGCDYGK